MCIVGDYVSTRNDLESTVVGRLYSFALADKQARIIRDNQDAFSSSPAVLKRLLTASLQSEFDNAAMETIYGFKSESELNEAFSCNAMLESRTPIMAIQPRDDPLHCGKVRSNIPVSRLVLNENIMYVEPSTGNHFGFYEGDLWDAFSNKTSYTWPARCAVAFFDRLIERQGILSRLQFIILFDLILLYIFTGVTEWREFVVNDCNGDALTCPSTTATNTSTATNVSTASSTCDC